VRPDGRKYYPAAFCNLLMLRHLYYLYRSSNLAHLMFCGRGSEEDNPDGAA
jgi:hypothetical protein